MDKRVSIPPLPFLFSFLISSHHHHHHPIPSTTYWALAPSEPLHSTLPIPDCRLPPSGSATNERFPWRALLVTPALVPAPPNCNVSRVNLLHLGVIGSAHFFRPGRAFRVQLQNIIHHACIFGSTFHAHDASIQPEGSLIFQSFVKGVLGQNLVSEPCCCLHVPLLLYNKELPFDRRQHCSSLDKTNKHSAA